jgi:ferric-dicitrate binding protein FerR (iron transport regulator)
MSPFSTSSVAAFVVELPADRFVEDLFPALAWAATVRLGDPAIASRLVERVMLRAWDERSRFATPESLYQHVRDTAHAAIEQEADRRLDAMRFDESVSIPLPGDLQSMSMQSVQRRLQDRPPRTPNATSPEPPVVSAAISSAPAVTAPVTVPVTVPVTALAAPVPPAAFHAAAAVSAVTAAVTAPTPEPSVTSPSAPAGRQLFNDHSSNGHQENGHHEHGHQSDAHAPGVRSPMVARWAARSVSTPPAPPAFSSATPENGGLRHAPPTRPHLRSADYIKQHEGKHLPPVVIGAIAVLLVVALIVVWRVAGASPTIDQALAALSDTTGVSGATTQAEQADVLLAGGSLVHLGADARLQSSKNFAKGARALRVSGPAVVSVQVDSAKPTAIASGMHRWMTFGVTAAFDQDGARTLVQVDSGAIELVSDSVRAQVLAGSAVSVDAAGAVKALSIAERDAAFAWRAGRLALTSVPAQRVVEEVYQWFGLALRYVPARGASDSLSLDVPLNSADSLVIALGAERTDKQLTVRTAMEPSLPSTTAVSAGRPGPRSKSPSRSVTRSADPPVKLLDVKIPDITLTPPATKPPV